MESALDRIEKLFAQKELDDNGEVILPASKDISLASDTTPESASPVLGTVQHEIEFSHVSFSYGKKNVLNDICLTADRGQMVALVGQSGSGKTTLTNLLARFGMFPKGACLYAELMCDRFLYRHLWNRSAWYFKTFICSKILHITTSPWASPAPHAKKCMKRPKSMLLRFHHADALWF